MTRPSRSRTAVPAAQALFFLNAAIWLAFGTATLLRGAGNGADRPVTAAVVGVLMFGNVAAMLAAGLGLGQRRRLFYLFAVAVVAANIILTVTDEFGLFDLITLALDAVLFGLLIALRQGYVTRSRAD